MSKRYRHIPGKAFDDSKMGQALIAKKAKKREADTADKQSKLYRRAIRRFKRNGWSVIEAGKKS